MYTPQIGQNALEKPERGGLQLQRGPFAHGRLRAGYDRLMRDVLGLAPTTAPTGARPWHAFSYFARDGHCVANVDAAILPLVVDGERRDASAIRSVAVDPAWRSRGLFRELMTEALAWCESGSPGPTLLYTEEPAIYHAFGFREVAQHAFIGPAPEPTPGPLARKLALDSPRDAERLREAVGRRTPASMRCTLLVDAPLFAVNLAKDEDVRLAYAHERDSVIAYEMDEDLLTLVDVVAPVIPDLAAILGALDVSPRRVKTLFPPDRLGWQGVPVAEDTGLMLRGTTPAAMTRPFMFPPTAEF